MTIFTRQAAWDNLRALLVFLGLVLHACWLLDLPLTHPINIILAFIHTFRVPAFFVMSGYFAALLQLKYGRWGLIKNRFCI